MAWGERRLKILDGPPLLVAINLRQAQRVMKRGQMPLGGDDDHCHAVGAEDPREFGWVSGREHVQHDIQRGRGKRQGLVNARDNKACLLVFRRQSDGLFGDVQAVAFSLAGQSLHEPV